MENIKLLLWAYDGSGISIWILKEEFVLDMQNGEANTNNNDKARLKKKREIIRKWLKQINE